MKLDWKIIVVSFFLLFISLDAVLADEIQLKNGDLLRGEVIRMKDNKLIFETAYAGKITIKWSDILTIATDKPINVVLTDDTSVIGIAAPYEKGKMRIKTKKIIEIVSFDLTEVKAINPKPQPIVRFKGRVNVGGSKTKGKYRHGKLSSGW